MNPIVEQRQQLEEERSRKEAFRYPVRVFYLFRYNIPQDANDHDVVFVRDFCKENNVYFSARAYDSDLYLEDRDFVRKLPAFQIYYRGDWQYACYCPRRTCARVMELIKEHKDELRKIEERVEQWGRRKSRIVQFFVNLFRKRSLLEKVEASATN